MKELFKGDVAQYFVNRTEGFEKAPPDFIWDNIEAALSQAETENATSRPFWVRPAALISIVAVILVSVTALFVFNPGSKNVTVKGSELATLQPGLQADRQVTVSDPGENASNTVIASTVASNPEVINNTKNQPAIRTNTPETKNTTPAVLTDAKANKQNISTIPATSQNQINVSNNQKTNITSDAKVQSGATNLWWMNAIGLNKVDFVCFFDEKGKEVLRHKVEQSKSYFYEIDVSTLKVGDTYEVKLLSGSNFSDYKTYTRK
ncbi:MAG: hypothetical protein KKA07_06255 [Bacteroidetes bacterium]|nr:hypothetical protein [Bacteroidota bacterium]MBU1718657.1 hypothetical protein [Bacteroidota bacterium]